MNVFNTQTLQLQHVAPCHPTEAGAQECNYSEPLDDADLLSQLRSGNKHCYSQLVSDNVGKMLAVARRYLSEDDAQDAVQEAFIKVVDNINAFRGTSSLSTWMHRIVVNTCLSRLRRRRPDSVPLDSLPPCSAEQALYTEDSVPQPDQLAQQDQMKTILHDCLARIPESYRMVILLRDLEGFTGEETALELGISANLVKVRLHRARRVLRDLLITRFPISFDAD